ncbi:MAG: hypothetical protein M2R45_01439 [Verrucomicrobia subdivision 3 bacterium]|nr:hypothetical protein [Limisphaerales bacterium]MCS1417616.1 hypothetical protein [Limisphaerales bacterium]
MQTISFNPPPPPFRTPPLIPAGAPGEKRGNRLKEQPPDLLANRISLRRHVRPIFEKPSKSRPHHDGHFYWREIRRAERQTTAPIIRRVGISDQKFARSDDIRVCHPKPLARGKTDGVDLGIK